jgi:hypothetical protein
VITPADIEAIRREMTENGQVPALLTLSNPKTAKGEGYGYLTAILHLSPARLAGFEVCASSTAGCRAACLNTAGRGGMMAGIHVARLRRTLAFKADRAAFMTRLEREIGAHVRRASRLGLTAAVRLNGTSDIPWEAVKYVSTDGAGIRGTIFDVFPDVQFYDYTKHAHRFARPRPENYDLTFSLAESNGSEASEAMRHGARVAVVFRNAVRPSARLWDLPSEWRGVPVVDADRTDLRFLDPPAVWCGLRAKGAAKRDTSGFVHDVVPMFPMEERKTSRGSRG